MQSANDSQTKLFLGATSIDNISEIQLSGEIGGGGGEISTKSKLFINTIMKP